MTLNGQRMSKSLGTIVDPIEAADRLGADPLRLYLVKEIAVRRRRRLLVGALRRALQRRPREQPRQPGQPRRGDGGEVSRRSAGAGRRGAGTARAASASRRVADYRAAMDAFALHEGAAAAFRLIDAANEFIASTEPWALAKDPAQADRLIAGAVRRRRKRSASRRCCCCRSCRRRPRRSCAASARRRRRRAAARRDGRWRATASGRSSKGDALWPRIETQADGDAMTRHANRQTTDPAAAQRGRDAIRRQPPPAARGAAAPAHRAAPAPPPAADDRISIDDFMKVELRVAKVLTAEKVPKSKKLLKLPSTSAPSSARSSPASPKPTSPRRSSAGPSSSSST